MAARSKYLEEILEGYYLLRRKLSHCSKERSSAHRLPSSQWFAMSVIFRNGEATVREIREALSITSSAATQLVNQLVKSGYVEKRPDPKDRRSQHIRLSPKAQAAISSMKATMLSQITDVFSVLTEAEFKTFATLHKKITRAITLTP